MTTQRASSPAADAGLVNAARGGDRAAFEALIQRHLGLVFSIASARLGDREAAEDLTQEVFLRAFLALGQLSHPSHFVPWLAQITRNQAASWRRREQRRSTLAAMVPIDQSTQEIPDPQPSGGPSTMETAETDRAVWQAIQGLPGDQRELVMLHFVEGLSTPEIARSLGLHRTTVRRQLRCALSAMRGVIESGMRDSAPRLRAPRRLASRTAALVGLAWALSPSARASLSAAAVDTAAPSVVKIGLLAKTKAAIAAGGKTMLTAKGIAALLGATVIGGGALLVSQSKDEGTEAAAPAQVAARAATLDSAEARMAAGMRAQAQPAFGAGMMVAATYATAETLSPAPIEASPSQQADWSDFAELPAAPAEE